MTTHSCVLAWGIPGMGKPGGLPSMGSVTQSRTRLKRLSSSSSQRSNAEMRIGIDCKECTVGNKVKVKPLSHV